MFQGVSECNVSRKPNGSTYQQYADRIAGGYIVQLFDVQINPNGGARLVLASGC